MASSLATHQFAGVSAQFKCVRARRRRGDIRDGSGSPLESGATRAIFPSGGSERAPRDLAQHRSPRARFPGRMADDPIPLPHRRSAVARKNVKAARNVQVRDQTGKIPSRSRNRPDVKRRRFKARAPGTRPRATRDRAPRPELRAAFARYPTTARVDRAHRPAAPRMPSRAAPVSRLDIGPRPAGTPAQKPD